MRTGWNFGLSFYKVPVLLLKISEYFKISLLYIYRSLWVISHLKCQPEYVTEEEDSYDAHQKFGGPLSTAAVRRRLLGHHGLILEQR